MSRAAARPTPAAPTKKSARRREDILRRAAELFDRKGYPNTSLDDIARAVGIRREGIYYYFRNRAEILLNIIEPQSRALIEGMRSVMEDPSLDNAGRLRAAIRNHLERFDRHCLEMTVSLRDGHMEESGDVPEAMGQIWKEYEQMWTRLIRDGQAAGDFRPASDPKMLAFAILGMCNWLARWYDPDGGTPIDALVESYADLVAHGLVPGAPQAGH